MRHGIARVLIKDRSFILGITLISLLCAVALAAPLVAPHDPLVQYGRGLDDNGLPRPPSREFILGTDTLGRDVLSRLVFGARVSLQVGLLASLLATIGGTMIGVIAGYFGGWVDTALMRFTDFMMAFPFLLFVLALVAVLGPSITNIFVAIASIGWITAARIVRGETLVIREMEYVTAARAIGASDSRILTVHVLPGLVGTVLVVGSLGIAWTILLEASLSYLGVGIPAPLPSWGAMLREGQNYFRTAPWLTVTPGLAIVLTVVAFNLVGDALNRALAPSRPRHSV